MKKKIYYLLISIIAFVVLLGVYFFIKNNNPEEEIVEEKSEVIFLNPDKDNSNIIEFTIEGNLNETFILENEEWYLKSNKDFSLSKETVTTMADRYKNLSVYNLLKENASDEDKKIYGLDNPVKITSTFDNNKSITVNIGDITPDGSSYYIGVEGNNNIYLGYIQSYKGFELELPDFINTYINFPSLQIAVDLILKQKDNPDIWLTKRTGLDKEEEEMYAGNFVTPLIMKSPLEDKKVYEDYVIEKIYDKMQTFSFSELIILDDLDNDSKYGFDNPNYEIHLKFDDESLTTNQYDIIIGNKVDTEDNNLYYVKYNNRKEIFTIDAFQINTIFSVNPLGLIEPFLSLIDIRKVDKIIIQKENNHFILQTHNKKEIDSDGNEKIVLDNPTLNNKVMEDSNFKNLYQMVIGILYDSLASRDFVIEGSPEITITYFLSDSSEENIVHEFFPYNNNFYIIKTNGVQSEITSKLSFTRMFDEINLILENKN